jgi:carboxyl-terminal processing protease
MRWCSTSRKRPLTFKWLKLSVFVFFISVFAVATPVGAAPEPGAKAYLDQALELIRLHHRKVATSDWQAITTNAQSEIANAKLPQDTYPVIRRVLTALNEPHSFFIEPSAVPAQKTGMAQKKRDAGPKLAAPEWKIEGGRFGVLALPELNTLGDQEGKKAMAYTSAVRDGLTTMDKKAICGWIVDLRQNGGGNMWPMLWGLDPLLGTSPFGIFLAVDGRKEYWVRAKGHIFPTSENLPETPPGFQVKQSDAPIAVLIGPHTGSSGEMVAIAFMGRKNVRHFGSPTAGFASANTTHQLSDGAYLALTGAGVSDRLGREYTGPIIPDEQVDSDKAESVAKHWLNTQCRKPSKAR